MCNDSKTSVSLAAISSAFENVALKSGRKVWPRAREITGNPSCTVWVLETVGLDEINRK